jgi:AhpD family alkylhydroperoxidase
MFERVNHVKVAPGILKAMMQAHEYLQGCGLEHTLLDLIYLRVSQMNGCAYCLDMHWKDLRAAGESEQRLYMLNAWDEATVYSDRERAALAWAEAVTNVADGHVPDAVYDAVREELTDAEIANLTFAVATINSWNRLNIALRRESGDYRAPAASR